MIEAAVDELVKAFAAASNYDQSLAMHAYMKNKFSFHGIKAPARVAIYKEWKAEYLGAFSPLEKLQLIERLWKLPEREYSYVAIDVLTSRKKSEYAIDDIVQIEQLITTNSWWDTVDLIASNSVGVYFTLFPDQISPVTTKWMASGNIWLQRTCLLFQLKYKETLDFALLQSFINEVQFVNEFFIQKAIGWSLRQHSKTNPQAVQEYIDKISLTGLACREASKYLGD